ncbi:MAG TPA: DUF4190 domain-containing protein [Phycisphaerae bacterium]|nr:DUF4190 domain-containing protein [Phycisphaerae bacterium]
MTAPQPPYNAPAASSTPERSGMALAALICGIIGVLTAFVAIGAIPGILAIVFAGVALTRMARNPALGGRGMAITGLVTGILSVAIAPICLLMIAILLPALGRARELANRSACAANARGIMEAMIVYANENNDVFPVTPYAPLSSTNAGASSENTNASSPEDALAYLASGKSAQNGSPLAPAWMLLLAGQVEPRYFICKSDPFATTPATPTGTYYANFQSDHQLSYSFAYPYLVNGDEATVGLWWKNTSDESLPLMSDMAPLNGTGRPARNVSDYATPRNANSANHLGEGQNVSFADGHAEFMRHTDVGQDSDNIFTVGASGPSATGIQPTVGPVHISSKSFPFDTVLLPPRDLTSGKLW